MSIADTATGSATGTDAAYAAPASALGVGELRLEAFGELVPISRSGGQGRVYRPARVPPALGTGPVVVKLYRRATPAAAAQILAGMVAWGWSLEPGQRARLQRLAAWPLSVVSARGVPVGIVMEDVTRRFSVPFVMPSGRRESVLLALEHLLGADAYLQLRGLDIRLDTATRAQVAERVSGALAFLHRHAIVASDIAPSNLLVSFGAGAAPVCLIDCDSMVFRGSQALPSVETGDWDIPAAFGEPPRTRAADAYKLGLVVLRLFARSHDARSLAPHLRYVPNELHALLDRALEPDAANRPPAGEWQRTLGQLLAYGHLDERYPGPASRPPVALRSPASLRPPLVERPPGAARPPGTPRPPAALRPPSRAAGTRALGGPLPAASSPAPAASALRPQPRSVGLRLAVMLLWVIAIAAVVGLLLSRLLAATVPAPTGTGFGLGVPAGGSAPIPYIYRYYAPGNPVQGTPYQ